MTKEERFNSLVFEGFKNKRHFDIIKYSLNRARELMLKHNTFKRATAEAQYEMCMTIYIIATQSATKSIHYFEVISKPEEKTFEYALDEGFINPTVIGLEEIKLLK